MSALNSGPVTDAPVNSAVRSVMKQHGHPQRTEGSASVSDWSETCHARLFDVDRRYGQQIEAAILTALVYTLALLQFVCVRHVRAQSRADTHAKVELGLDESSESAKTVWVGVVFHLVPGWHIYWQNPGDSGEPPKIQWELPAGFRAGAVRWPQPIRLGSGSVVDYGYEGEVLLAAPIERPAALQPGLTAEIAAAVNYVVCREICIPGKAHLTLPLPAERQTQAQAPQWHALFQQARAQLPKKTPADWKVSAESDKDHFTLSVQTGAPVHEATFFPLQPGQIDNSAQQVFESSGNGFRITLRKSDQLAKAVPALRGLIVLGPGRAFEIAARVNGS